MNGHPPPLINGLWCATLTPIGDDGRIDHARSARHVQWLFSQGVLGIAPFGTTGEGQSFSVAERREGLEKLLAAGVPGARIVAGTGCAALPETIELTRHAVASGCKACLVLPPFFWKGVSDDGLFAWYAKMIEAVGDNRLRVMLYHLPQVSSVALSVDLVARLASAFPGVVAGIKDSEGNWEHTSALLARVPQLTIVIGHEPHLPKLMKAGGAGTICGVANAFPKIVQALLGPSPTREDDARIARFIEILFAQPFLAAFKSIVADRTGEASWCNLREPMAKLTEDQRATLRRALEQAGFTR
jgi:4-hydroxy-tetrahydrodipicolinate synthase